MVTVPQDQPVSSGFLNSIVIDRKPWITTHGIRSIAHGVKNLYFVTNNPEHPVYDLQTEIDNLIVIPYQDDIDFSDLFQRMYQEHGAERITIQSGGELNAIFVRAGLVDHLLIVVAPLLVGGKETPTLVDGCSFQAEGELLGIKTLQLTKCEALKDSYIRLEYDVIQNTVVDPK